MAKKSYIEPDNYFPKTVRKEFKIGEYNEDTKEKEKEREKREVNKAFREYVNKL